MILDISRYTGQELVIDAHGPVLDIPQIMPADLLGSNDPQIIVTRNNQP